MIYSYRIEGEDVDGNFIDFEIDCSWDEVVEACQNILFNYGGGHLDIFSNNNDSTYGTFIDDVEV